MEDSTAFLRPTGTAKSCCSDAADGNEIKEADRIPPAKLMTPRQFSRRTTPENTLGWPWCAPQTVIHWLSERKASQNSRVFWSRVPSSPADKTRHPKMIWALWVSDVSIGSSMVHGRALPAEQVPQALCCIPLWSNKAERLARNATILPGIRELAELGSHNVNSCSHMGHAYVWLKIWVQKELLQTAFCFLKLGCLGPPDLFALKLKSNIVWPQACACAEKDTPASTKMCAYNLYNRHATWIWSGLWCSRALLACLHDS